MLFPDVNILVYALREEMPQHIQAKAWLENALAGSEPVGIFEPTLASLLRITTNTRIFKTPTPLPVALAFANAIRSAPAARAVTPHEAYWPVFERICLGSAVTGNDIPDAYLAAIAIQLNAELVSSDKGFSRFKGLRYLRPF